MKKIAVLVLLAIAGLVYAEQRSSPVVYPAQRIPLTFSHKAHLARGQTCETCHANAAGSRSSVDDLMPEEKVCAACHAIDRAQPDKRATPVASCAACHPGFVPGEPVERVRVPAPPLKFSHAAHSKQTCASCHGELRDVELATEANLPAMSSCFTCHTDGQSERHCTDCHLAKPGGLMETTFEQGDLVPAHDGLGDAHGPGFSTRHAQEARQVGATCTACHDRSECVACHQGVTKPQEFHPGDYVRTHAVDARRGTPDCSACHRAESFCVACHERSGVATRGLSGFDGNTVKGGTLFHPPGWASTAASGSNRHAGEARRDMASCASCHREEDCLKCHTAEPGKPNASPHGAGWKGSARCRAMDRENRRMCLRCHVRREELGCDW